MQDEATKSKALIALRELGCKSWKERSAQLEKLKPEIQAYFQEHGLRETKKKYRFGASSMRKLGISKRRKPNQEEITPEELIKMLPEDTDVGFLLAKGLLGKIANLEKQLTTAQTKITELEKELKAVENEKKKLMETHNEALAKAKTGRVSLADLQHAMGRGSDGTRQSFNP